MNKNKYKITYFYWGYLSPKNVTVHCYYRKESVERNNQDDIFLFLMPAVPISLI